MKNITFKKVDIHLKRADYEKLGEESGNFRVRIHDSIRQERILDDGFRLEWNRKVTLEPESLYRILVVFEVECFYDDQTKAFLSEQEMDLKSFIEKNQWHIMKKYNVPNRMSFLIAQLSAYHRMNPLITPPVVPKKH